jgi:hypothetical protein
VYFPLYRVPSVFLHPRRTWLAVASEQISPGALFFGYILPLAAIGPVATFVALRIVGVRIPAVGVYRAGYAEVFAQAGASFVMALAGAVLVAWIVNQLAPVFGAQRSFARALRVAAYSLTPAWVGAALSAYRPLAPLQLIAVAYGFYLLYLGLRTVMRAPAGRAIAYAAASIAVSMLTAFAAGSLFWALEPLS